MNEQNEQGQTAAERELQQELLAVVERYGTTVDSVAIAAITFQLTVRCTQRAVANDPRPAYRDIIVAMFSGMATWIRDFKPSAEPKQPVALHLAKRG